MLTSIINFLKTHPQSGWNVLFSFIYRLFGWNRIVGIRHNEVMMKSAYLRNSKIIIHGENNVIDFSSGCNFIKNSSVYINGSNNTIRIGERNYFDGADFYIEDDNCSIILGGHNRIFGKTHFAAVEGTGIIIGDECLFSDNVVFRTTDSHSILDADSGVRINPSKSITVGSRVWFGNTTTMLKGIHIDDDCVIGTCAVVTKDVPHNCIVAGNPAKVVRQNVIWTLQRIDY